MVRDAHEPELEITGLCFAQDGRTFASRGADATLKVTCMAVGICHWAMAEHWTMVHDLTTAADMADLVEWPVLPVGSSCRGVV